MEPVPLLRLSAMQRVNIQQEWGDVHLPSVGITEREGSKCSNDVLGVGKSTLSTTHGQRTFVVLTERRTSEVLAGL